MDLWGDMGGDSSDETLNELAPPSNIGPGVGDSLVAANGDAAVRRAVDDLTDDWHRQGGSLSEEDVTRLVAKRALTASQQAEILDCLDDLGVTTESVGPSGIQPSERQPRSSPGQREPDVWAESLSGTSLSADQLKDYLRAIARTPLLRAEDEVRIGRAIQAGLAAEAQLEADPKSAHRTRERLQSIVTAGRRAQGDLIEANLRLVVSIAKLRNFEGQGLDLPDRIQEGNFGLLRAAVKFDPNLGFKFSTYATWWIRQAINRGLADRGRLIRLPVHVVDNLKKIKGARRATFTQHDREPTLAELADATGLAPAVVQSILDYYRHVGSLDAPVASTDGDLTFGDLLSNEADFDGRNDPVDCALASSLRRDLDDFLAGVLTGRERDVLQRRNGYDGGVTSTLDDIGRTHQVTRERIRQIETKAYAKVRRSPLGLIALHEYLFDGPSDPPPLPASLAANIKQSKKKSRVLTTAPVSSDLHTPHESD